MRFNCVEVVLKYKINCSNFADFKYTSLVY